ncbi:hypothetical protein [Natrinema sp. H-ect4]|uniref:DUF7504 family protein n=1 Tax=Natrinema sp. H-ect4 TaxID=3242699 RepID=UPI0035A97BAE
MGTVARGTRAAIFHRDIFDNCYCYYFYYFYIYPNSLACPFARTYQQQYHSREYDMDGGTSERGSNRLLLGPLPDEGEIPSYLERVRPSDRAAPKVVISTRHPPSAILDCRQTSDSCSSRIDIISVSGMNHGSPVDPDVTERHTGQLSAVNRSDLTGLGTEISELLSRRDHDAPVELWFDSVTSLIPAIDFERVFRFLHILTARVERLRATAFYLVDPAAHDPQTVTSLTYLFDTVLEMD